MTFIKKLGIDAVQLPHTEGEIAVRRLDQEVIVVVHQAVGVADPIVAFVHMLEGVQKIDPVLVALENRLSLVTPGGYVINSTGVLDS
jgi:hypothetical protein